MFKLLTNFLFVACLLSTLLAGQSSPPKQTPSCPMPAQPPSSPKQQTNPSTGPGQTAQQQQPAPQQQKEWRRIKIKFVPAPRPKLLPTGILDQGTAT
jgi:hypothetical protein